MIFKNTVLGMALTILLCASANAYDTKLLSEIPLKGKISAIAVNTTTDVAAVVSAAEQSLSIIDMVSFAATSVIALPGVPSGVAVHKGLNRAIVATSDGSLLLYDFKSGELTGKLDIGTAVYSVVVDESNNRALLGIDGGIKIVDLTTGKIATTISSPGRNIQLSLGKSRLAVVSRDDNGSRLRLIDPITGIIVAETPLLGEVISIGMDEQLGCLLVTLLETPGISLYDAVTLRPLDGIPTSKQVQIISVNPSTHIAVLADTLDGGLAIADLAGKTIVEIVPLYGQMGPLSVDTARNRVLAAHNLSLMVIQLENPVPRITGLVPQEKGMGEEGFPLTVIGEKFIKDSRTSFAGTVFDSNFVSNELIKATIPAEKLLLPGDVPVSVTNPLPGGGVSNELKFKILTPAPQLTSITPATVVSGGPAITLRVMGKAFLPTAVVNFNGKKLPTNFLSSIVLEATINAGSIAVEGSYPVSVTSNGATSFTSNALPLAVVSADEAAKAAKTLAKQTVPAQGSGSLVGRILNTEKLPLKGVTIKFRNTSTRTDVNGVFTIDNLPVGKRTILIDGSTAEEVSGHYPVLPISVDITANMYNQMPFTPHLHRQKSYNFANINPATDTVLTDPEIPGFEMRIPKGVHITGWDGNKNQRVSVRTVPTDRLPIKSLPNNSFVRTVHMFYFDKVGGGKPDRPIPIKTANDLGLLPGEKATLWYYDESPNEGEAPNDWAIAGTGTVTPDGRYIVTDPDVGIPKFCCGATGLGGTGASQPPASKDPNAIIAEPIDASNGYFIHEHTELVVPGVIPLKIKRVYRSRDGGIAVQNTTNGLGSFGKGMYVSYDWWLGSYSNMFRLTKPGSYQYDFALQGNGSYVNTIDPDMRGAKVTVNADSTKTLRMRDGWSYTFNSFGDLVQVADRNGNALTIARVYNDGHENEGGRIASITTAEGRVITFNSTYTGGNFFRIDSISDQFGRTVTYTYENDPFNPYPRLKRVDYPDGSNIQYGYDTNGFMNTITNGRGIVQVTNIYDANYRVIQQTLADNGVYTYAYTGAGGYVTQTTMTAPNGAQTTWQVNNYGYITGMTTPDGTTTYNKALGTNEDLSITDPINRTTTYTYYSTTDATNGLVKNITDPMFNVTQFTYEPTYGLPTGITDARGKNTTFSYTPVGVPPTQAVIKDPLQNQTTINFNSYGMPTGITDPNSSATTFTYDPNHHAELTQITDALGNPVSYAYDAIGRLASITDGKGATTKYGFTPTDRLDNITDAYGNTTQYYYDGNGNLKMVVDAKLNALQYEYDNRDRISKMTDQLGRYETYAYYTGPQITATTGDNLMSYTDRKGQTTTFNQYDPMNRLKQVTFGDSSYLQYTYDAVGRATNIFDSISGAIGYTYNDFGCSTQNACSGRGVDHIYQETTPLSALNYSYDADRRRTSMTVAGEPVVTYGYDDAGRPSTLSRVIGSGSRTYNFGYYNGSRRKPLQIPLANGTDNVTTTYGYDIANRITSLLLQGAATQIDNLTYTYDANGNRTNFTRTVPQTLSPAVSSTNHDAANEMLALGGKSFTYDLNGNLLTRTDVCGATTYSWDARNRLIGISGFKPDCTALTASFGYDAINRRSSRTLNGATTQFVNDGWDIIQEINGGVKSNYVRSLYIDEPLTRITGTTIRHYAKDALGSVMALEDDTGATRTTYVYDVFGNATVTGEASDNPFQYTGRENDGTGLYYYRARYFSPEMHRFVSEDPIRLLGGSNFYSYVQNNPVNRIDTYGLLSLGSILWSGISNGLSPNGPWEMAGTIAGSILAAPAGAYIGTAIGGDLGLTAGAIIGSPAGPGGFVVGAVAGSYIGGYTGAFLGGIGFGYVGGYLGGKLLAPLDLPGSGGLYGGPSPSNSLAPLHLPGSGGLFGGSSPSNSPCQRN